MFLTILFFSLTLFISSCHSQKQLPVNQDHLNIISHNDTLAYQLKFSKYQNGNCEKTENNCLNIQFSYPYFTKLNNPISSYLNQLILDTLINKDASDAVKLDALSTFFEMQETAYLNYLKEAPEFAKNWEIQKKVKIVYNSSKFISLALNEYNFTGGAHGNQQTTFININILDNNVIDLHDVIHTNTSENLRQYAEKEFRKQKSIPESANLEALGFWFENNKFSLSKNFALSDSKLILFYNNYEIAPYAMGTTQIDLPISSIKEMIKKEYILPKIGDH